MDGIKFYCVSEAPFWVDPSTLSSAAYSKLFWGTQEGSSQSRPAQLEITNSNISSIVVISKRKTRDLFDIWEIQKTRRPWTKGWGWPE